MTSVAELDDRRVAPGTETGSITIDPVSPALLEVRHLRVRLRNGARVLDIVRDVSFDVRAGECLGVVGESGCGKSTMCAAIPGLSPTGAEITGSMELGGRDIRALSEKEMRVVRGREIGMIFQDPRNTLNPIRTVGSQIVEKIRYHLRLGKDEARAETKRLFDLVRIPAAARRMDEFPHQLSGGLCQRVAIAMALACRPRLLIADEPTTALDVSIQAQILHLLSELRRDLGMAVLLVTHDLGVISEAADRAIVMYGGEIVEEGHVANLVRWPMHPYTDALLGASPDLEEPSHRLRTIPGAAPNPDRPSEGCAYRPRCARASAFCEVAPELRRIDDGAVRCHLPLGDFR